MDRVHEQLSFAVGCAIPTKQCDLRHVQRPLRFLEGQTMYNRFGDWFVALSGILVVTITLTTRYARGTETRRKTEDSSADDAEERR